MHDEEAELKIQKREEAANLENIMELHCSSIVGISRYNGIVRDFAGRSTFFTTFCGTRSQSSPFRSQFIAKRVDDDSNE